MSPADSTDNSHEYEDEPELAGYVPHGDTPLRSPRRLQVMRVVVVLGLLGLVLPGILSGIMTAHNTAQRSCDIYTRNLVPEAVGFSARFELMSNSGTGWNCYAISFGGDETLLAAMGVIPGGPRLAPPVPREPATESRIVGQR
ncbi:MAG: hypothetical protein ACRCSP_02310 [Rhodoglobus sp.]